MTDSNTGSSAVAVNENGESIPWGLWNVLDMIHENRATGGWDYGRHLDNDQRKDWGQFGVQLWMKYGVQYIWVDSLCIDQTSVQDKANEIPKMAEYYAGALR